MLSGCAPFVEYEHLSDPRVSNDGYDLLCGGIQLDLAVELSGAVCGNIRGGEYVKINAKYVFEKE